MANYYVRQGDHSAIDVVGPGGSGVYGGKSQDELARELGVEIEIVGSEDLLARTRVRESLPPRPISDLRYDMALGSMPPLSHVQSGGNASFFLGEAYTADVHWCYVRLDTRHFEMRVPATMAHAERVELVLEHLRVEAAGREATEGAGIAS